MSSYGFVQELDGKVYATVEMPRDLAGNIEPDHNVFRMFREDGQLLYVQRYDASLYRRLYETEMMTGTSAAVLFGDLTPSDWDSFYNMIDACEYWKGQRLENSRPNSRPNNELSSALRHPINHHACEATKKPLAI